MSRDAEGVGRCKGCGDSRPLTEAGYCNDDCAPCGCMEAVALRAEVERFRRERNHWHGVAMDLAAFIQRYARPRTAEDAETISALLDSVYARNTPRSALSPKVPE